MDLYSIKMRAAKGGRHISGAERIVSRETIPAAAAALAERALCHAHGCADFINIRAEAVAENETTYLEALKVSARPAGSIDATLKIMEGLLAEIVPAQKAGKIIELFKGLTPMRGAVLYDIRTGRRLEPDKERGIRVTYMDAADNTSITAAAAKNHFREALVLATKVVNAPGMLAELCMSDDPDYVTGYFASKEHGYVRLCPIKEKGSGRGGRIFVFDSAKAGAQAAIHYLEKEKVLVRHVGDPPAAARKMPAKAASAAWEARSYYRDELTRLNKAHLYRSLRTLTGGQAKYTSLGGRRVMLLSSNSYLDLTGDARVKKAAAEAALVWGAGSGGSRLTTGNTSLHEELETELARFKGTESALLFNTGYMANVGIISALCDKESVVYSDEFNHASIIDGCRLSGAEIVVYKHNDMTGLEAEIRARRGRRGLIVSDAVFSMDGDIADLPRLCGLGRKYSLLTMLDEAHATGVIGRNGRGIVEYYGEKARPDILMGTLSKALGAEGGFACADRLITEYLKNKARSFIFATSQPPAVLGAALAALHILESEPQLSRQLQENTRIFLAALKENGISAFSPTAIVPIVIGDEEKALKIASELLEEGILIPAIRYPTVTRGTARLRAALMASHTQAELERAARLIAACIKKYA